MIFPGAYSPFGGVCAINVWWSVLDAFLFRGNKSFNVFGSFVVKFMEERFEASKSDSGVDLAIGVEKFFF
jgi:hypothetical protein